MTQCPMSCLAVKDRKTKTSKQSETLGGGRLQRGFSIRKQREQIAEVLGLRD